MNTSSAQYLTNKLLAASPGTGLGRNTVLSIVNRYDDHMMTESGTGTSNAFTVFLPDAGPAEAAETPCSASRRLVTGRVLVMDDEEQIRALTSTMLESLGYQCDLVPNGEEAVECYRRQLSLSRPYDAVIMDLTINGGLGGEPTFRLLRDLDPGVRAIIASGYDSNDRAGDLLDLGFRGYLAKPYRVGDLDRMLRLVTSKRGGPGR